MASTPIVVAGRTAVITGAGSGIGRALAQRLAAHGCPVALCDWNEEQLKETVDAIGGPVLSRKLDVRDRQGQMTFAAEARDWAPAPIGMVVNNAGVTVSQTVAAASPEDDDWCFDVNFWGVVHGTRAWLPVLTQQGSGAIVNVSSVFGLIGYPTQSAYCASKFAVRGFTESLRHELRGSAVRAITVHPGGVRTNIVENARFHVDDLGALGCVEHADRRDLLASQQHVGVVLGVGGDDPAAAQQRDRAHARIPRRVSTSPASVRTSPTRSTSRSSSSRPQTSGGATWSTASPRSSGRAISPASSSRPGR